MVSILQIKTKGKIINSPHFWAIIVISLFLIFVYRAWPWRIWQLDSGIWQWFPWLSKLALVEYTTHIIGIPFLVLTIYAVVIFSWKYASVICLLSFIGVLPIILELWKANYIIFNVTLLVLPILITLVIVLELRWRTQERRIFAERETERQIYVSKVLESQENERRRIAQELHDDIIQSLLVIANQAQTLIISGDNKIKGVKRKAELIKGETLELVDNLRRISLDLRPSILDNLGLIPALRWLAEHVNKESNIDIRILVNGVPRQLPPQTEVAVFRIVQEALNNIKRHSQANVAVVTLKFATEWLRLTIEDNGKGLHLAGRSHMYATGSGLGLIGMQERVKLLNGKLKIRSEPSQGTKLSIVMKC